MNCKEIFENNLNEGKYKSAKLFTLKHIPARLKIIDQEILELNVDNKFLQTTIDTNKKEIGNLQDFKSELETRLKKKK